MRENSCRWDLSSQEKLPNHNHRQTKIAQKLIEKESLTAVAQSLAVSTSIVIRKLKEFEFKTELNWLPDHMSGESNSLRRDWDRLEIKKTKFFIEITEKFSTSSSAILKNFGSTMNYTNCSFSIFRRNSSNTSLNLSRRAFRASILFFRQYLRLFEKRRTGWWTLWNSPFQMPNWKPLTISSKSLREMPLVSGRWKLQNKNSYRFEHKERENESRSL